MRTIVAICAALSVAAITSGAATVTGTVHAEGKAGADQAAAGGKYESRKLKFVERVNYAELRDFVVYIDHAVNLKFEPPAKPLKVAQKDGAFTPHVLPVLAGSVVEWPNNDDIFHNVFSISESKTFDLDLYNAPEIKRVTFEKTGRVDVFCSIHTRMHCIILVLENPWFAVTDAKGKYTITNIPPGTYKLKAWHERLPSQVQEITVPEQGEAKVDFTLGITNLPKY
ncbi:MAG: carboxypeptidase regulatory-like domain-containing protein [Verrucomicrobiota bacterium]